MPVVIGLTGGIGSGKSTVSARLAELGAVVIDADALAHEVVRPGTPGLAAVIERFGPELLREDGSLDRAQLGSIVFNDKAALKDLTDITHPLIQARIAELTAAADAAQVLVHDTPLLVESPDGGRGRGFAEIVIVMAPEEVRIERLAGRGMAEDVARARMANQATDEQRRAAATVLLDNSGTREHLMEQVDALWQRLTR